MTESPKRALERQLWNIADQLRGKMHANELYDYCLSYIFKKYLYERLHRYANHILALSHIEIFGSEHSIRPYPSGSVIATEI